MKFLKWEDFAPLKRLINVTAPGKCEFGGICTMKRFLSTLLVAVLLLSLVPAASMAATRYASVTGGWLRLRSAPNFNASTITSYYTGTQVEVLGTSGSWYHVKTPDGRTGYMHGDYLVVGGSVPSFTPDGSTAYVTSRNGYGVRLRKGPSTSYRVIRTYAVGTPVTVLERGTYWCRISVNGTVGYMMSEFLNFTGGGSSGGNDVVCYATIWSRNGYGVRLRTGPGKGYSKIGVYDVGTTVAVLEKGRDWDRIRVGSRVGWMMNEFLDYKYVNEVTNVTINNYAPIVGSVLSVQAMTPSNATVGYEWIVGGTVKGSSSTYTVDSSDVGKVIQLRVTGNGNFRGSATSAATNKVVSNTLVTGVKLNTTAPVVGNTLSAVLTPADAKVAYAWKVGGYQVSNAATYTVTAADVGKQIELIVSGTGAFSGSATSGLTAAVSAVSAIADVTIANKTNPTAGAAPTVGDVLTATPSPAQATVTYQWKRDGAAISGATSASYTVAADDVGKKLTVTVTGTGSYSGEKTSSPTGTVAAKPSVPVISTVALGNAKVGEAYNNVLSATGGGTITWEITTGADALKTAGINFDAATGLLSGTPTVAGNIQLTFVAKNAAGSSAPFNTSLAIEAAAPAPAPKLEIGNLVFETAVVGYAQPAAKAFTVTNSGDAAANVTGAALSGTNSDSFTLSQAAVAIQPNSSDTASYTVQPKAGLSAGTYSATLVLTYDGGATAQADVSFTVTDAASTPANLVIASPVDFGTVEAGTSVAAKSLSIENNGGTTATITSVAVDNNSFAINDNGSSHIDAGVTDTSWNVTPKEGLSAGTYNANVTVIYDGSKTVATTVKLEVTATTPVAPAPAPAPSTETASLSIGNVNGSMTEGDTPAAMPLSITNSGTIAATITAVSVSDTANFSVNKDGSSTIAAGATDGSWKITPSSGLAANNTYSATVTVNYQYGSEGAVETSSASAQVSFAVNAPATTQSDPAPSNPDTPATVDAGQSTDTVPDASSTSLSDTPGSNADSGVNTPASDETAGIAGQQMDDTPETSPSQDPAPATPDVTPVSATLTLLEKKETYAVGDTLTLTAIAIDGTGNYLYSWDNGVTWTQEAVHTRVLEQTDVSPLKLTVLVKDDSVEEPVRASVSIKLAAPAESGEI